MKNKIFPVLFALVVVFTTNQASAYYSPSTGRWLSRDPNGEPGFETLRASSVVPRPGQAVSTASLPPSRIFVRDIIQKNELNSYVLVKNDPESKVDFLGLTDTDYYWQPSPCGSGMINGFIQVFLGGSTFYPHPFVDDASTHGHNPPNCPPLYPGSYKNTYDDPLNWLGTTIGLNGLKVEVCQVCLKPCCGSYHNSRTTIPFTGYSIVKIGPCKSFTIPGDGGKENLDTPGVATSSDSPSAAYSQTVNSSYPNVLSGGCIQCKKPN